VISSRARRGVASLGIVAGLVVGLTPVRDVAWASKFDSPGALSPEELAKAAAAHDADVAGGQRDGSPNATGGKYKPADPPPLTIDENSLRRRDDLTTESVEVLEDGQGHLVQRVSTQPVRYKGDDGKWRDIDATLEKRADGSISAKSGKRLPVIRPDKAGDRVEIPTDAGVIVATIDRQGLNRNGGEPDEKDATSSTTSSTTTTAPSATTTAPSATTTTKASNSKATTTTSTSTTSPVTTTPPTTTTKSGKFAAPAPSSTTIDTSPASTVAPTTVPPTTVPPSSTSTTAAPGGPTTTSNTTTTSPPEDKKADKKFKRRDPGSELHGGDVDLTDDAGATVSYGQRGANLEESVIVGSKDGSPNYSVTLSLPDGLTARQATAGIEILDRIGNVVLRYGGGIAWDASYDPANPSPDAVPGQVTVKLIDQKSQRVRIDVSVDAKWFNDPARVFPVTIDPMYSTLYTTVEALADANAPNTPNSPPGYLAVGWSVPSIPQIFRSYMGLAQVAKPTGASALLSASIRLTDRVRSCPSGGLSIGFLPVVSPVTPSLTWNSQPGSPLSTPPDGWFPITDSGSNVARTFSISNLMNQYFTGAAPTGQGILLKAQTDTGGCYWGFEPSYTGAAAPTIQLVWSAPGQTSDALRFGFDPYSEASGGVNSATGNYFMPVTDVSIPSVGPSLGITRSYNSLDPRIGAFGLGWTYPYDMTVIQADLPAPGALAVWPDGHEEQFVKQGSSYVGVAGFPNTLVATGTGWDLKTPAGTTYSFVGPPQSGVQSVLSTITDLDGNKLTFSTIANGLQTITSTPANSPVSRTLTLTWAQQPGQTRSHVVSVKTDPVTITDAAGLNPVTAPSEWKYYYVAHPFVAGQFLDQLSKVCTPTNDAPTGECTTYTYSNPAVPEVVQGDGPVAYWHMDDATPSSIVSTVGAPSRNLLPVSGVVSAGQAPGVPGTGAASMFFSSGNGAMVSTNSSSSPVWLDAGGNKPFSAELWVKMVDTSGQLTLYSEDATYNGWSLALSANSGYIWSSRFVNGNGTGANSPAGALPVGSWAHVATTWDGSWSRIYVNGAQVAAYPVSLSISPPPQLRLDQRCLGVCR
jgi:hypothetical protein